MVDAMLALKEGLPPLPQRMQKLPVDARGYPVPWFVGNPNGVFDFRVIRAGGIEEAIRRKTCWLCGDMLGSYISFVIGPMCAVTRTTSEPGSHYACACFAVRACPFLINPAMRRSPRDLPEGTEDPAGIMIERNPGASCLWVTRSFKRFNAGNGMLISVGEPIDVEWWAKGRHATREEVQASINSGLPLLLKNAPEEEHPYVIEAVKNLEPYLPKANAHG